MAGVNYPALLFALGKQIIDGTCREEIMYAASSAISHGIELAATAIAIIKFEGKKCRAALNKNTVLFII